MNKLLLTTLLWLISQSLYSQKNYTFNICADSLGKYTSYGPTDEWLFMTGDDRRYADTSYNDLSWQRINSRLYPNDGVPEGWDGIGWFRLWLNVDSSLVGKILAFKINNISALQVYMNGGVIYEKGIVSNDLNKQVIVLEKNITPVEFAHAGRNLLAVRFSNPDLDYFHEYNFSGGFSISFGNFEKLTHSTIDDFHIRTIYQVLFISVPLALAVLHLFLFIFDVRKKNNLFYTLFLVSFALFISISFQQNITRDIYLSVILYRLGVFGLLTSITMGCITIYSMFGRLGRFIKTMSVISLIISIVSFFYPVSTMFYISYIFIMVLSAPTGYTIWQERKDGLGGEWIIRIGFVFMSIMGFSNMLQSFGILPEILGMKALYIWGVLGFIFFMSVSLARDFFVTNKRLEKQLDTVKELSELTLRQELEAKELESKKQLLEADNERKTKELESARKLQLSMLPQNLPEIDNLEIAAHMLTASEVGGDYYDFAIAKDGTLNIAVGDATGHGTKAGIMVATVKSLFSALGTNMMINDFFRRSTEILKNMNLGNLFMSMTLLRIKNNYLIASSAGMPPVIVFKKSENIVEEYVLKGMPLGAFLGFEYETIELELHSGDIILLMSDGLPELFNNKKEMYGDKRILELVKTNYDKSPEQLIDILNNSAVEWRGSVNQADDITFVVLKVK